ncbi:MAG: PTS sugar transporter subunit IIA [Spirochaetes bacterium]|nr:PTS sugar transporter subunit IIA [Spirochaetota bacterium]
MYYKLFTPGTVVIELRSTEKFEAIRELIREAKVFQDLPDRDAFEQAVIEREKLQSTGLGHGVAFAHGRIPEIKTLKVALGISRKGIDFDSIDGKPVHLLFVFATNPSMHIDYLACLASLAKMVKKEGFREQILACYEETEVTNKLCDTYMEVSCMGKAC